MATVGTAWCRYCEHPAARPPSSSKCLLTLPMPESGSPTPGRYRRVCTQVAGSGGLRRAAASLGARVVVRLTRPQSGPGEGLRAYHRFGHRLPYAAAVMLLAHGMARSGSARSRTLSSRSQQDPPILSSNVVGVELVPARTTILHVPAFVPASAVSFTEPVPGAVPGSVILDTMISPAPVSIV
jgi:hypothetical protein